MIPIYLCEDNQVMRDFLANEIEKHVLIQNQDMKLVCATDDPKKILDQRRAQEESGIYFLDIDLGIEGFNGFDLAKELRKRDSRGVIVFVTTHGELSMETFRYRLEAMDYILKDDAGQLSQRVRDCLDSVQERMKRERAKVSEYYSVKVFDSIRHVPVSQILCFETSSQKHRICLYAEREVLEFFGNLQAIEEDLGKGFFRCHRAALVNRDKIFAVHLKTNEIELLGGHRCPLSRKARKELETS